MHVETISRHARQSVDQEYQGAPTLYYKFLTCFLYTRSLLGLHQYTRAYTVYLQTYTHG